MTTFDAPTRSRSRAGSGVVKKLTALVGFAIVISLPAVWAPAFVAVKAGTQFGTGDLPATDFFVAAGGFLLGVVLAAGVLWVRERAARRGGR